MKKFLYSILFFIGLNGIVNSQVPAFYEKYYNYEYAINPAITGRDYYPVVNLSHKKYWLGTADSPSTTCFGGTFRLGNYNFYNPKMLLNKSRFASKSRMGFGGFIMHEKDGPLSYMHGSINYAYFIPLNQSRDQLSFGLSAQLFHYSINESLLNPLDEGDEQLIGLNDQKYIPEAGFGVYFHNNQLSFGMSLNDLFLSDVSLTSAPDKKNKRDLFIQMGYKFFVKWFEIEPSVFTAQIDEDPLFYSGQLKLYYMNYNWVSISYKSTEMLSYAIGFKLNRFYAAYIFEHSLSSMIKYYSGAHEIMLGINIGLYEAEGLRKIAK